MLKNSPLGVVIRLKVNFAPKNGLSLIPIL